MDVSIIIVNYNTKELAVQCINSIFEKTFGVSFEIIVVDNNSSDGSQSSLSQDSRIKFVEAGDNLGFGKANNLGVEKATGKYMFFLNSDTILVNNALKLFFDYCESIDSDSIGAVGCLLENPQGETVHSFGKFPSMISILTGFVKAGCNRLLSKSVKPVGTIIEGNEQKVDYVTGADVFVRREVLEKYGAFDPDFFMYYEDTEMQNRWQRNGLSNMIIQGPRIIHLEGCSTNNRKHVLNERKLCMGLKSQQLYFKKTENKICYWIYRIVAVVNLFPVVRFKYNLRQIREIGKIIFSC